MMNPYYNKNTMNIKQLARDLENQCFTCKIWEDSDCLIVSNFYYLGYVVINLTNYKVWLVTHFKPFCDSKNYKASTNWSVVKLLKKILV